MKILRSLLLYMAALLTTLLVLEAYLHLAEIQTPLATYVDPDIGPTYVPNKRIARFNEGFYLGAVNEYGYLGPSYPPEKTGDGTRVLLLGDSYVMGITVFERHHFGRLLERDLGRLTGREVQTLNFGKADFNLSNLFQYHHDFASRFEHDVALFFVDRDDLVPARQVERDLYPYCTVENGKVAISYDFRSSARYRFYRDIAPISANSSFFRLVFNARKMVLRGELTRVVLDKLEPWFRPASPPAAAKPARPRPIPETTPAILAELARDPRNILVLKKELRPDLREAIAASGLPVIDLEPTLTAMAENGADPYYWPVSGLRGHWNHEAHARISEKLADEIFRLISEESPAPH